MTRRILIAKVALLLLMTTLVSVSAVAAQDETPPFFFEQTTPVTVTADDAAAITILNRTTEIITLSAQISGFVDAPELAGYFTDLPGEMTLQSAPLVVELALAIPADAVLEPGTYGGYLTVASADHLQHLPLAIVVADDSAEKEPLSDVEPLLDTWTVRAYCTFPSVVPIGCRTPKLQDNVLPLDADAVDVFTNTSAEPLGIVANGGQNVAEVSWSGTSNIDEMDGNPGMVLAVTDLDEIGSYSGKIDILPENDEKGDVSLTVVASDRVWYPFFVALLGIFIAYLVKNVGGVNLPMRRIMLNEVESLGEAAQKSAKNAFKANLPDGIVQPEAFNMQADFEAQRVAFDTKIQALSDKFGGSTITLDENNREYSAATKRLTTLKTHLESWPQYGAQLAAVKQALDAALADGNAATDPLPRLRNRLNQPADSHPGFKQEIATKLLTGGAVSVDAGVNGRRQLSAQRSYAAGALSLLEAWPGWVQRTLDAEDLLRTVARDKLPAEVQRWYDEAAFKLSTLCVLLWRGERCSAFAGSRCGCNPRSR